MDPAVDTGASDYEPDTRYPADSDERAAAARGAGHCAHAPEGAAHNPDGTVTYPDGTVHRADGTTV